MNKIIIMYYAQDTLIHEKQIKTLVGTYYLVIHFFYMIIMKLFPIIC